MSLKATRLLRKPKQVKQERQKLALLKPRERMERLEFPLPDPPVLKPLG